MRSNIEKLLGEQVSTKWRGLAVGMSLALLFLTTALLTAGTRTARAESVKASNAATRAACRPIVGASPALLSLARIPPPPSPVRVKRVGYFQDEGIVLEGGGSQWCWGQNCVHSQMNCVSGASAESTSPCCVRCCWNGDPWNCSQPACCN